MPDNYIESLGITLTIPCGWYDVTATLGDEKAPFTLAKDPNGNGALQFSAALYKSGVPPDVSVADLRDILNDFAKKRGLGALSEPKLYDGRLKCAAASFKVGADFQRVWYCSDGNNILFATYTCSFEDQTDEIEHSDAIVKSSRFE